MTPPPPIEPSPRIPSLPAGPDVGPARPTRRTVRVRLDVPTPADADEFLALMRENRAYHAPWATPPATPEAYRRYLDRLKDGRHAPRLARRNDSGRIIGAVNLSEIVHGALQGCYAGWYGSALHAGEGLMTDAVAAGVDLALRGTDTGGLGLHRVEANIQPGNLRSRRLARRVGFRLEGFSPKYLRIGGRWCDHERWAITREMRSTG
ncbi:MAG: GNAT family N-acetyltransferase [Phycisphaerales bacterium]